MDFAATRLSNCVFAMFCLGSIAMPAFSQDHKSYPGTQCQPVTGISSTIGYSVVGPITNKSTTSILEVTCPVIRDVVASTSGVATTTAVNVFYTNASTELPLTCTFFSNSYYSAGWFQTRTQTNMVGTGIKVLVFDPQDNSFIAGNYNLWCRLPLSTSSQTTSIFQYIVTEKEP